MTFERLRGFRDLFPEDAGPKFYAFRIASEVASSFGFQLVDIPSVESLEIYRVKSGEELVSQTFSFKDKGGREVTMIPEATPSVVRMLTSRKELPKPVRWFSLPKIWRYEEPQSGRLREHIQFNADIFGVNTPEADAELIGLSASILDRLGLGGAYELRINDRVLMESILRALGVDDIGSAFSVIDRFRKISRNDFRSFLTETGLSEGSIDKLVTLLEAKGNTSDIRSFIGQVVKIDEILEPVVQRMQDTLNLIAAYTDSPIRLDFSTVRGLAYYTGIVFEAFDVEGELRSILGGGRYDNLSKLMSNQDIPAVGFGMGDVVLELLLKRRGLWKEADDRTRLYFCVASHEFLPKAVELANDLRNSHFVATMDISRRSLSAQLKNASISGSDFALILGKKEIESNAVTVRRLRDGKQTEVKIEDLRSSLALE